MFPTYSFSVVSQPVSVRKKCCNTADSTFITARRFTFIFLQFFQTLHLFFSIATFSPFACFLFESDIPHHSLCSQDNIFVFILRFVILFSAFVKVCRFFHADCMSCQIFVTSIIQIQIYKNLCIWPLERQFDFTTTGVQFKTRELGSGENISTTPLRHASCLSIHFSFTLCFSWPAFPCACHWLAKSSFPVYHRAKLIVLAGWVFIKLVHAASFLRNIVTDSADWISFVVDKLFDDWSVTTTSEQLLNPSVVLAKHIKNISLVTHFVLDMKTVCKESDILLGFGNTYLLSKEGSTKSTV